MTFLGSLFQCLTTLTNEFFLMFKSNVLYRSLCQLPLVHSVRTTEKSLFQSSIVAHQVSVRPHSTETAGVLGSARMTDAPIP